MLSPQRRDGLAVRRGSSNLDFQLSILPTIFALNGWLVTGVNFRSAKSPHSYDSPLGLSRYMEGSLASSIHTNIIFKSFGLNKPIFQTNHLVIQKNISLIYIFSIIYFCLCLSIFICFYLFLFVFIWIYLNFFEFIWIFLNLFEFFY